ncbi:putative gustatory receptor 28b [Leptopilina boulardi]|uniref:putative gustatory receptor 28b n=1 Tax=Leptopilina boulardi TaxID=63433 RepID=UPI0021F68807|nr:putative gustatory receptor 28b [Leptopilina boulardi]
MVKSKKLPLSLTIFYFYGKLIGLFPLVLEKNGTLKYSRKGIFYSIISHGNFYAIYTNFDWLLWTTYNLPQIVVHNLIVLFITILQIFQRKFCKLNKRLRHLPLDNNFRCRQAIQFDSLIQKIEDLGNLHKDLVNLSLMIVDFFGSLILILLMAHFFHILYESHGLYQCIKKENFQGQDFWLTVIYLIWFTLILLELFFVAISSGSFTKEANNTGNVLHKMWSFYRPTNCQKIIQNVSQQLLQRKMTVSLHGFINLNFNFIFRIFGTVTTYLIIMLQLDDYKSGKEKSH